MKKLLQTLLFALIVSNFNAQNGFTIYTTPGIAPALTKESALLVDNLGNTWVGYNTNVAVGTNVGLLKHNGTTSTFYKSTSIPAFNSFSVTSIVQDGTGNIWIGSELGLTKFTGTSFVNFDMTSGLPDNAVNCIEVVGSLLYIGTNKGLSRYDGVGFSNYNVAAGTLPNDTIKSIKMESSSVLWLGGINRLTKFNYSSSSLTSSYTTNTILPATGAINCVFIDALNNKWLGTSNVGVLKYNGTSFTNLNSLFEIHGSSIPKKVLDICLGLNNGICFRTNLSSISTSSTQSVGFIEFTNDNKIFQYYNNTNNITGDYLKNYSGKLVFSILGAGIPKAYGKFDKNLHYTYDVINTSGSANTTSNNFKFLDINAVKAGIANRGDMHWDLGFDGQASYEFPKGSGKHSDFTNGLWVGGLDASNQLYQSTQTYRQSGSEFWPGPLDTTTGTAAVDKVNKYDKIWKVSYTDINDLITNFSNGNLAAGTFTPTNDILSWPGNGTDKNARQLAPFVDYNNDGIYNPYDGDYPKIKGDQALYFIFNNNFPGHGDGGCNDMGLEIQAMAYAYGCPTSLTGKPELNATTFYNYKITNRSNLNFHDVYFGLMSDADMGNYNDDYFGCNVKGNYGFVYNGDTFDESISSSGGYGNYLPASGHVILKGPKAPNSDGIDNDNDGIIDELGEECKLNKFTYFNNNIGFPIDTNTTHPSTCQHGYNYLSGKWKNGTPFTCGGSAYGGSVTTNWAYPGDPLTPGISSDPANLCGYWTDSSTPGDRRFIISSGPFNFNAGQTEEIEYAVVNSIDSSLANNNLISLDKLKSDINKINNFYNLTTKPNCLNPITIGVNEILKQNDFSLFPNPANESITVKINTEGISKINYEIIDVLGKTITKNEAFDLTNININISNIKSGVYFIKLQVNNSTVTKKFVKQ